MCRTRKEWRGVSEVETITTGVVLGPLLFNAYIAPLTTHLQKAQHSPSPIRRRHSTLHHFPTNRPHTSPRAYGSLRHHHHAVGREATKTASIT